VAWLESEAVKEVNLVAIQRDTEVQKILVEAIGDQSACTNLRPAKSSHRPNGALASGRLGMRRPGKRPWS
jgi:hypothetical protein